MERREDWPERLNDFIESRRGEPFKWGSNDCCLFAADAVQAMTDIDLGEDFRGKYRSASGAVKKIKEEGGLVNLAASRLKEEVPPLHSRRGDILLVPASAGYRDCLAVCLGDIWAGPGEEGIAFGPLTSATKAWRV